MPEQLGLRRVIRHGDFAAGGGGLQRLIGAQRLAQHLTAFQRGRLQRAVVMVDRLDQFEHVVAALEQQRDQRRIHGYTALAQAVEYIFDDMREPDDGRQAKQPSGALDGMCGAKHRADGILITWLVFQLQQGLLHDLQQLACLDDKGLLCLIEINTHLDIPLSLIDRLWRAKTACRHINAMFG
jgi:hypothetical protein